MSASGGRGMPGTGLTSFANNSNPPSAPNSAIAPGPVLDFMEPLRRQLSAVLEPIIKDHPGDVELQLKNVIDTLIEHFQGQLDEAVRPLQQNIDDIRARTELAPTMSMLTASACSLLIEKQREVEMDFQQQLADMRESISTSLSAASPILEIIAKLNKSLNLASQAINIAHMKLNNGASAVGKAIQEIPFIVIWTALVAASVALTFAHLMYPDRVYEYYPVLFTSLTLTFAIAHYSLNGKVNSKQRTRFDFQRGPGQAIPGRLARGPDTINARLSGLWKASRSHCRYPVLNVADSDAASPLLNDLPDWSSNSPSRSFELRSGVTPPRLQRTVDRGTQQSHASASRAPAVIDGVSIVHPLLQPHTPTFRALDMQEVTADHIPQLKAILGSTKPSDSEDTCHTIAQPHTSMAFSLYERAFPDSSGKTVWYESCSEVQILHPPGTCVGAEGDLYLHFHNQGSQVWVMTDTWTIAYEGIEHPHVSGRTLRIRTTGEPVWLLRSE
ncbi:hypothetical protein BKA70DRAFT_1216200 [Coprinopsis sp. MPI-PUGE-AT-0042]|nr:hypothetical protein BKA70DRAFT_1216200 [Coprinopsis sp. MPI-PUGE-AT-0042]